MRRFAILCVVVILLTLLTTSAVFAQEADNEVVYCGDLSDADCALLNASANALWSATSGESAKSYSVYLTGIASLESEEPTASFNNRSLFVADMATIAEMEALSEIPFEELSQDSDALQEAMLLPLNIDNASVSQVAFSPELTDSLSQLLRMNFPSEFMYETRMVDGVVYINLAHYKDVAPDLTKLGDWIGIDLMAFVPRITADNIAKGIDDPATMEENVEAALTPPGKSVLVQPYLVKMRPDQAAEFNEFLEMLPLRDVTVDDQVSAVYRTKMDVSGYVGSPVFAERFLGADPMSAAEPDMTMKVIQGVSSALMNDADAVVVQAIGYDDAYLYGLDMELGMEVAGYGAKLDIQGANANINGIESISAPTDAFVLPIRLIMGLIDTVSGQ